MQTYDVAHRRFWTLFPILGVGSALLWRAEIQWHGWPGPGWLDYFHWAVPVALVLFIAASLLVIQARRPRLGSGRFFALAGVFALLAITGFFATSWLYVELYSRLPSPSWHPLVMLALLQLPPVVFFAVLLGLGLRPRWRFGVLALGLYALAPLACAFLAGSLPEAIKRGWPVPFLFFAMGVPLLPAPEEKPFRLPLAQVAPSAPRRSWLRRWFPFGLLWKEKPRHFREMLGVLWENRRHLLYAWRILRHGVCDGCSLGPRGLRDDVIDGSHLCLTRLKLLRLNTMGAIADGAWEDLSALRRMTNEELHRLGRIPYPLVHRKGEQGFRRIGWDEAIAKVAGALREAAPDRMAFFASSRGVTNEAYYALQKLARIAGTPHVDSCARLCHAASATGLKEVIGWGAPTCSLKDLIGTDLVVLFGTDLANNQPMTMKYLHFAKKAGTRVVVVNPFREPALDLYWVPSVASSAIFGTELCDDFFQVAAGGDIAFISGALKTLAARGQLDRAFIEEKTEGFDALARELDASSWDEIETSSGLSRAEIERFAEWYGRARSAVIVYSMGLTQHRFGVENVKAVVNLALARGNLGREKTGIIPIRGHSGVQGTAECGVDPDKLPGAAEINEQNVRRFEEAWGHPIPHQKGLRAAHVIDASAERGLDVLYAMGGNYLDTLPDPLNAAKGLARVKLRVHQDILINTSALVEPEAEGGEVLLLPAQTRYEQKGGGTSTSTERRVRFSPEIRGPRIAEAKAEWEIPTLIGRALRPEREDLFPYRDSADLRAEMGRTMPLYAGIEKLAKEGDWIQWGGERLGSDGFPNMPNRRARFTALRPPRIEIPEGKFLLGSRRGKQFNSITYGQKDGITGARSRRTIFLSEADAARLGLAPGARVRLSNELGTLEGEVAIARLKPQHVQAFWPECNTLLARRYDPVSGEPDYHALVAIETVSPGAAVRR